MRLLSKRLSQNEKHEFSSTREGTHVFDVLENMTQIIFLPRKQQNV